jgi:hypothetical protein
LPAPVFLGSRREPHLGQNSITKDPLYNPFIKHCEGI